MPKQIAFEPTHADWLNRAYSAVETRSWIVLRLESIAYVLLAALALLALGFLIVLGPLLFRAALRYAPWLEPIEGTFTFLRFGVATIVLVIALFVAHKWLPAGRRRVIEILPGIAATLALWLAAGIAFGRYLAEFSITHLRRTPALALSGGERRRVEIARALASQPHVMLLDEPLAGIDPIAVGDIRDLVSHLKDRGIGVLITDHNVRETLEIVDRAYILHDGRVLMEGAPAEIVAHEDVRRVYLGERFSL